MVGVQQAPLVCTIVVGVVYSLHVCFERRCIRVQWSKASGAVFCRRYRTA